MTISRGVFTASLRLAALVSSVAALGACATSAESRTRDSDTQRFDAEALADPLAPIAWLAAPPGGWVGGSEGRWFHERWSPPRDGLMLGTFRMSTNTRPAFAEFIVIAAIDDASGKRVELRVRHFDPDLRAWEELAPPPAYRLVSARKDALVFERPGTSRPQRQIYVRTAKGMRILVETERDGVPKDLSFDFQRADR